MDFLNALLPQKHQIKDLRFKKNERLGATGLDRKSKVYNSFFMTMSHRGEPFYKECFDLKEVIKTAFFEGYREGYKEGYREGYEEGIKIGKQQGIEIGRKEANKQTAQNLKSLGLDAQSIAKATGLWVEEVENL